MINLLYVIYLFIAGILALLTLVHIIRSKQTDKAINLAILLIPLVLRALRIK